MANNFFIKKEPLDEEFNKKINQDVPIDKVKQNFTTNIKIKTEENIVKKEQIEVIVVDSDSSDNIKKYRCKKCNYSTDFENALKIHNEKIHLKLKNFNCKKCDFITHKHFLLLQHQKTKHLRIKKFTCDICGYKAYKENTIKKHKVREHSTKPFLNCITCTYRTHSEISLNDHIKKKHYNLKCPYCDLYGSNNFLEGHIIYVHRMTEKFKCEYCNYKTFLKESLEKHIDEQHKYRKVLRCKDCKFKTIWKGALRGHEKSVHKKYLSNDKYSKYQTYKKKQFKTHMTGVHGTNVNIKKQTYSTSSTIRKFDYPENSRINDILPASAIKIEKF